MCLTNMKHGLQGSRVEKVGRSPWQTPVGVVVEPVGWPHNKPCITPGVFGIFGVKQPAMEFLPMVPSFLTFTK